MNSTTANLSALPLAIDETDLARCIIEEDGTLLHANSAFLDLIDQDNTQNTNIFDIFAFSEDDIDEELSNLNTGEHNVHIKGNPVITEFRFDWVNTADNRRVLIASALDQEFETDKLSAVLARPITQKSSETQTTAPLLEKPEYEDLETFVTMTHDVMLISTIDGEILSANSTFKNKFGYTDGVLSTLSFFEIFEEEEREKVMQHIQNHDNEAVIFETKLTTLEDKTHIIRWRQKIKNDKIYVSGRDITDIKLQENHLKQREKQLSEAEAIARMGHWRWVVGSDDVAWSDEIFRIFAVDKGDFTPTINNLTERIHRRDVGRVIQIFQRALIEEKNYDMDFRIQLPDGETRYILCEGRCEKDEDGDVIALYGIMQDMTERMLYERELKQAKDAAEQAYAAKTRFLANMSHELRTPLNAIIGFSEMIEHEMLGPIFNDKYTEYATSIRESGHHLLDLISDILDMSKIEAGKHTLDPEEISLDDIISRANNMVQARAQDQNIDLRITGIENSDLTLTGDRRALTQIMLNLLSNAIKFTPENGKVWIEIHPHDEHVTIKVCDTGIGIPPNKLASVLKPFEQVSSEYTRDHEGTGLGLSITKELIELHGGSLSIESEVNVGTTAFVRLPYK